ncbi:elongation factor Ts, mitochondrial isoform X2 [Cephus cinctus]|nr:elongation factor Ts, mitochondrial isoform X2 [Cephus cinctus]XP_015610523.1 elongation factor Ts, mitochondrial isoform X2 [Cephus cinctus]XP_015610524.1 elongation factor Ts, mitochondrial isoform X2 [Cephus cinctus]XP_015610526.1 elongation factor Ts, mitochondrial isoform X2 [Cephus cinctus]
MISNRIFRLIHTNGTLWQATNKSLLAKLRKKTGYTFTNCKKALELHENNLEKAEQWLNEQAQNLGWSKAAKLQGRPTAQGLIAVIVNKAHGALVEINCETDFVARNKQFHKLTETVALAVLKYTTSLTGNDLVNKALLDSEALNALSAPDGKLLADHSALTIGSVGENLAIKRALCMSVQPGVTLAGYSHPASIHPASPALGRYGTLLALKGAENNELLPNQLCQHIIGMNPLKIGDPQVDQPMANIDDETTLIYQEYLLDPTLNVQQVLIDAQAQVLDFARFEMGEIIDTSQSLDSVETCG